MVTYCSYFDKVPSSLYISQSNVDDVLEEVWICDNDGIRDELISVITSVRDHASHRL